MKISELKTLIKQVIEESKVIKESTVSSEQKTIYHSSKEAIEFNNYPMFASLDYNIAFDGWFVNNYDDADIAHLYEVKFNGVIADHPAELFEDNGLDYLEYEGFLVSNPTQEEILEDEGTQLLINNGYDALIFDDYDPTDWQKDMDAILVFKPQDTCSIKLIGTKK